MKYRTLGHSDLKVSCLSFGAWQLGDTAYWGEFDEDEAERSVAAAIDAGINLFDTAEGYGGGKSEAFLARALGRRRDEVLIATKVSQGHCAPVGLRQACEASLQRLGTDRIDIYQVHWPDRKVAFADTSGALESLRDEGKIREIGVSNFGRQDLNDWPDAHRLVSNQLAYNLIFRAIEFEIIPACDQYHLGVLAYMPLMQGLLCGRWRTAAEIPVWRRRTRHFSPVEGEGRHGETGCEPLTFITVQQITELAEEIGLSLAELALGALLAQDAVSSVIIGCRRVDQVRRNLASVDIELDEQILARVDAITRPLKDQMGSNADMWETESNLRIR